jgi:hypothetical protein
MDMICRHNLLSHFLANMGGIYILVVVAVRTLYWRKIWQMQLKLWLRTTIQNYRRGGHILRNRLPCIYAITYLWIISWSDFPCSDFIFLDQLCEVENIRYPIKIRRTRSTDYHVGMSESYWPTVILQKLHIFIEILNID